MIYTLNLIHDRNSHPSVAGDLNRLCTLITEGRLDGQIDSKPPGGNPPQPWRPTTAAHRGQGCAPRQLTHTLAGTTR
jgi:hypothetical protein